MKLKSIETVMKCTPLLFKPEMVLKTLADLKTQTRRVVKNMPSWVERVGYASGNMVQIFGNGGMNFRSCPYGQPGDRLWVRETWRAEELESGLDGVRYAADNHFRPIENTREAADAWGEAYYNKHGQRHTGWRPSIFMPRWASRITLEIVSIRVERLQDISEQDAKAEGAQHITPSAIMSVPMPWERRYTPGYRLGFEKLWDSINASRGFGWDVNPWVWVVGFKRVQP